MNTVLSLKEERRRQFILTGNLWKVILYISYPLAIYNLFNYLYGFLDMVMVAHIGSTEVSAVVFFDEIKNAIAALGAGIAAGGSVIVARHYGAGNINKARENANAVFLLAVLISIAVILVLVPFSIPLLTLLNTPQELISSSLGYFNVQVITTALIAINSVFIGLEKAKGNTKAILYLNLFVMVIKIVLTALFVYRLNYGVTMVAVATLIAQGTLTVLAFIIMTSKHNSFRITLKDIRFDKTLMLPILMVSLPIFFGKFLFSFGKVIINSMASYYGPLTVGALGIASKLCGWAGTVALCFEESSMSIISQNIGNRQLKRAFGTFYRALGLGILIGGFGVLVTTVFIDQILPLFISTEDPEFIGMIKTIFEFERFSAITSAIIGIVLGLVYGFRFTKIAMFVNLARLFILRIPVLLMFQYLFPHIGYEAVGYTMFISNFVTAILALVIFMILYRNIKNHGYYNITLA